MPIHISDLDPLKSLDTRSQREIEYDELAEYKRVEGERLRAEGERLRAEGKHEHAQHMAQLSGVALWLHRPVVAIFALIAYVLLTLLAYATSADAVYWAIMAGAVVLAVVDWHNFRTFHGRVNWPLLKLEHPAIYRLLIVGMVVFFFVPAIAYLAQCLQTASAVREARHARIMEDIARLEQELQQMPPPADAMLPQTSDVS